MHHLANQHSALRKILSASFLIALCTLIIKVVALCKEQVVAHQFGTSDHYAAFVTAIAIPGFCANILTGSINAAFIPSYIMVREKYGIEAANYLLQRISTLLLVMLLIACGCIWLVSKQLVIILASTFSDDNLDLAQNLLKATMPMIAATALSSLWAAVLNAQSRFAAAALVPGVGPIAVLITLMIVGGSNTYVLAYGTVIGAVCEAIALGVMLKKRGIALSPRCPIWDVQERGVVSQLAPMVAGTFIGGSNTLIDNAMAAMLAPASVTSLAYATRLASFPLSIGATALGTAAVPYLTALIARNELGELKRTVIRFALLVFVVMGPITACMALWSRDIVELVFHGGSFTLNDSAEVASVLALLSLQIPFYITGTLLVKALSCLLRNRILLYGTFVTTSANVALNFVFMKPLGVSGIALSTSCVAIISNVYCGIWLVYALKTRGQAPP